MNGCQLNVLLVDDNEQDYIITRNLLTRIKDWHVNLEWTLSFDEGVEKLSTIDYTVCLFNYEDHGNPFIKQAFSQDIKIPLIALLESENPTLINEAMEIGAVDYLVKTQLTAALLKRALRYAIQYNQLMAANVNLEQEVVETKQEVKSIEKRSQQYEMLFDINIYAVEVLNADGVALDCNPMYQQLIGYTRDEIVGQVTTSFMTERSRKMLTHKLSQLAKQPFIENEVELVRKDGTKIMVWRRARAVFGNNGTVTGMVAYSRDITERMKAVKQISILARALEQSAIATMITDYRGRIEYTNFEYTEMTGYTYEDVAGKHIRAFKLKHLPRDLYEDLWETINTGDEWRGEFHNLKKNDEKYWEALTITPVYNSKGALTHFVVVQEDITQRIQNEAEAFHSHNRMGELMGNKIRNLTSMNQILQKEIEERKRAEIALQRNRARLKAQYNGIPVPTYSWQVSGDDFVLVDYNSAAEKSSNGRVIDILGKKASEVFKDRSQVRADFERSARDRKLVKREAPYRLVSSGETRHFVTTYNFVPPNLVIVHIEDITEHKHAQGTGIELAELDDLKAKHALEVINIRAELEQTQSRLKEVANNIDDRLKEQYRGIPIPTYTWQVIANQYILVDFNDAAAESMGRIIDFFGKSAAEIFKERPQVLSDFKRCYREKQNFKREAPYKMVTTGETRFFVTSYLYTPPNLIIVHIQDITEYKAVEAELIRYRNQHKLMAENDVSPKIFELEAQLQDEIEQRELVENALHERDAQLVEMAHHEANTSKLLEVETALRTELKHRQVLEERLKHLQNGHNQTQDISAKLSTVKASLQIETEKRQKLEQTLAETEERMRAVANNIDERMKEQYRGIPIPTYSWQRIADEFVLVDFNDAAADAMGRIVDFFGKKASEIFKDRDQVLADFETSFYEQRDITREAPYTLVTSGETRFFVTSYIYTPPNMVIVHIQDITEYKKIEDELTAYKQGLNKASEAITQKLADIKEMLQHEQKLRKRVEKLLNEAQLKLRKSKKWIKAMAEEHTVTIRKLENEVATQRYDRHQVELARKKLEAAHKEQTLELNNIQQQGMVDLSMMNEQLQRELSELRQAEEAIRHNRARLKAQYKSIPIPTYSWQRVGGDFILVDYNDAVEKTSQGRIFDFMGTTASEAFKERPVIIENLTRCFSEKKTVRQEASYELVRHSEDQFFVTTYNFVPPNLVMVYVQDITAQKKTELALMTSEEQMALHCRFSPEGKLTFVNDAYCWYFNTEQKQLIGQFVPFVYNADLPKVKAHFAALTDEENSVSALEFRVVKPSGALRWQQWITLPIFDQGQGLIEIQGVGRDITRRKQSLDKG
ncbi:PAS domain S-box protein [Anaerolineales bacterium HSG6]|nr:PAS domain S-box protein [Anaerolineales bacterium HSG6]